MLSAMLLVGTYRQRRTRGWWADPLAALGIAALPPGIAACPRYAPVARELAAPTFR